MIRDGVVQNVEGETVVDDKMLDSVKTSKLKKKKKFTIFNMKNEG